MEGCEMRHLGVFARLAGAAKGRGAGRRIKDLRGANYDTTYGRQKPNKDDGYDLGIGYQYDHPADDEVSAGAYRPERAFKNVA